MDDRRFDDIVRAFGGGSSRRAVVRRLGVGLAGLFAGAAGREATEAAERRGRGRVRGSDSPQRLCKQAGRPCSFDTHCCSFETAGGAPVCCRKRCCGNGQTCAGGQCTAAPPVPVVCSGVRCGGTDPQCPVTDCACSGGPAGGNGNCTLQRT